MNHREQVHKFSATTVGLAILFIVGAGLLEIMQASVQQENTIIDLWSDGVATFGVFVPDERPRDQGGRGQRSDNQRQPPLYTVEGGKRLA